MPGQQREQKKVRIDNKSLGEISKNMYRFSHMKFTEKLIDGQAANGYSGGIVLNSRFYVSEATFEMHLRTKPLAGWQGWVKVPTLST